VIEEKKYDLQIVIISGPAEPEKVVLGLAAALTALHSGLAVRVVFAMRGATWCAASEGNAPLVSGYPPIGDLIDEVLGEGAGVFGCSSCIDQYCPAPLGDDGHKVLRRGVDRAGLSVVTLAMTDTPTVTF
jgi:predicted peroxiredoxin